MLLRELRAHVQVYAGSNIWKRTIPFGRPLRIGRARQMLLRGQLGQRHYYANQILNHVMDTWLNSEYVPQLRPTLEGRAIFQIIEDKGVVINMTITHRCPALRHVVHTRSVNWDCLFELADRDLSSWIRHVSTSGQMIEFLNTGQVTAYQFAHNCKLAQVGHLCCAPNKIVMTDKSSSEWLIDQSVQHGKPGSNTCVVGVDPAHGIVVMGQLGQISQMAAGVLLSAVPSPCNEDVEKVSERHTYCWHACSSCLKLQIRFKRRLEPHSIMAPGPILRFWISGCV